MTISPDQTYVAVGHTTGNVYLYDLASPSKPARSNLPLTLRQVLSGRKEGHLQDSRILHIGFVGARHTSIVTADEDGRAFWFSLGKVVGVESNDVIRMLGSNPEPDVATEALQQNDSRRRSGNPSRKPSTLFAALPLPRGERDHPTDEAQLTALLTPTKLVVVGMKPQPKTWYRRMRHDIGGSEGGVTGCAAWLRSGEAAEDGHPVLVYSWGTIVRLLRVETKSKHADLAAKGELRAVPEFFEGRQWQAPNSVRAIYWFDTRVSPCIWKLLTISTLCLLLQPR